MAYLGEEVLAPAKTILIGTVEITVENRSKVVTIAPAAGSTLTEADSCELYVKVAEGRSVATAELLGSTKPSFEIVARGKYLLKRVKVTTEDVGGYVRDGFQAAN